MVGEGRSADRLLSGLIQQVPHRYQIAAFGADQPVGRDPAKISLAPAGECACRDGAVHDDAWRSRHGATHCRHDTILAIDAAAKAVTTAAGRVERYDKLILATGSTPVGIRVPGAGLPGVVVIRDLDDVDALLRQAAEGDRAIVIGGGLSAIKAAEALRAKSVSVSVVHATATLMERQLDAFASDLLRKAIEQTGVEILAGANVRAILGDAKVEGVRLDDDRVIAAEIIVVAVGVRPNVRLAKEAGLVTDYGVVVDDTMRTSDDDIYAVGRCVQHRGRCYGAVPLEMADVLVARLSGDDEARYQGSVASMRSNIAGVELFSAGDVSHGRETKSITLRDDSRGVYKRIALRNDRIVGVVLCGETSDGPWFLDLITKGVDIEPMRDVLIFGGPCEGRRDQASEAAVAALPDKIAAAATRKDAVGPATSDRGAEYQTWDVCALPDSSHGNEEGALDGAQMEALCDHLGRTRADRIDERRSQE